jgi:hypothetical protein
MPERRRRRTAPSPRPAAVTLGTDAESGGHSPDPETLRNARHAETRRAPDSIGADPVSGPGRRSGSIFLNLAALAVILLLALLVF